MIPKIIHYVWFGGNPLPDDAVRCIDSWRRFCPDYEIKEWNESNFDVASMPYTEEAYKARKFAFVADYVRLYALYYEGGIYMDTDVEVLKSLDPLLPNLAFSGFEDTNSVSTGIMASEKGGKWAKDNMEYYHGKHFLKPDGSLDMTTNVAIITRYMKQYGIKLNNTYQEFPDLITMYPKDYFCPKSHNSGRIFLSENSYTIHHFANSWEHKGLKYKLNKFTHRALCKIFGEDGHDRIVKLIRKRGCKNS